jgi:hypothetical protein
MRPPLYKERLVPRSITLPVNYARTLIVLGDGNMSQGVRKILETHYKEDLEVDRLTKVETDARQASHVAAYTRGNKKQVARKALENPSAIPKKRGRVPRGS